MKGPPPHHLFFVILLAGHQEFGDALVMNGLVRKLVAVELDPVWLVNARYVNSVRRMMSDLPGLRVTGTNGYDDVTEYWLPRWPHAIKLGFFAEPDLGFDQTKWDQEFYRHAGVDFNLRWDGFKLGFPVPEPVHRGILVHEDPSRGYRITRRENWGPGVTHITPRPCILDWVPDLLGARELHFIDSAFLNLAESLYAYGYLRNTRLVFHQYAKTYPGPARWPTLRAPWEIKKP